MRNTLCVALLVLPALNSGTARADWLDDLAKQLKNLPAASTPGGPVTAGLSDEDIGRALKEALAQGTRRAVDELGREGGFFQHLDVKIPLPDELKKVEKLLRGLGQEKYADQFVAAMNQAAERAVPEAAGIFADAITRMTLADAKSILQGPDDAATRFFRKTSEAKLRERFRPAIQAATDQAGVTAAYKKLMRKAGPTAQLLGVAPPDLDAYVEGKAMDGLFKRIAAEEKRIRQDPLARATDLLKKVFGSLR